MSRLKGKVAIVTGGGRGIGAAIVRRFSAEGARVVAAQRDMAEAERTIAGVNANGGDAIAVQADVTVESSVERMVETTLAHFGTVDILCNNAGIGGVQSLLELEPDYFSRVMNTNVLGVLLCTKHVLPTMAKKRAGSVINIASICSFRGLPRSVVYCASKGALLMATRQTALDFAGDGVRVNAIAPGFIGNEMFDAYCDAEPDPMAARDAILATIPLGTLGDEEDVAAAASYLASSDSRWMTGSTLVIDGGSLLLSGTPSHG